MEITHGDNAHAHTETQIHTHTHTHTHVCSEYTQQTPQNSKWTQKLHHYTAQQHTPRCRSVGSRAQSLALRGGYGGWAICCGHMQALRHWLLGEQVINFSTTLDACWVSFCRVLARGQATENCTWRVVCL